ncbi:Polysaccharide biosynthesis protein [Sphingomonas gellani]|uniref:Polysaccharide biosynthesis protein n=1 Tax=Sphingomonas gellani TaxID=1166340 RepID=A0A1H8ARH5_9SPHN|nr:oligosaccharide flippase family protein [Sphingomonas gellani]SEM73126.1 Polysaccharide biosynthesis protein [Sphingomonas gellani]
MREMSIEEIHRRARRGPMLLLLRRALSLIITLLSTILIARLVGPRAYGLAAMSAVVLSFLQVFRDYRLTNAMLWKPTKEVGA